MSITIFKSFQKFEGLKIFLIDVHCNEEETKNIENNFLIALKI